MASKVEENTEEIKIVSTAITRLGLALKSLFEADAEEVVDDVIEEIRKSVREPDDGMFK